MTTYNPNGRAEIESLFSIEGDALLREGFKEPNFTDTPEDYKNISLTGAVIDDRHFAADEAARLGIDLETYLEG